LKGRLDQRIEEIEMLRNQLTKCNDLVKMSEEHN